MKSKSKLMLVGIVLTSIGISACTDPADTSSTAEGTGYHTYNTYLSTKPKTWNTHNWESSDESYIPAFCEMGFYDLALNETNDGYVIVNEMAAAYPEDVTEAEATPEVKNLYGYTGNLSEGYIWDIELNPEARWEDGTPITADDYVQSLERQLNPKMVNFRADSYYASSLVVANAEKYFKQGRETLESLFNYINEDGSWKSDDILSDGYYYFNIAAPSPYPASVFSGTDGSESFYTVLNNRSGSAGDKIELAAQRITDAAQYYAWKYCDHAGDYEADWAEIQTYSKLSSITEEMLAPYYIKLDDFDTYEVKVRGTINQSGEEYAVSYSQAALKEDIKTVVMGLSRGGFTSNPTHAWKAPLFGYLYNDYQSDFSEVGIKKITDHKLRLFLGKSITKLDLQFSLTSNWLVKVDLYDALTISTGGLVATGYASPDKGVDGYMSYGPYKLETYEAGKSFRMVKNDQWYGYTDGKHEGQYVMDCCYTRIIEDHNTALQEFLNGNLDDFALNRNDMKTYGNSSRLTSTYESYTQKISFNSQRASLLSRQKEAGKNKTILSNIDFRRGLSLALDRNDFAAKATAGSKGFTGLLNDLYLTDVEAGEMYRNTTQGKSVYQQVYGTLGGSTIEEKTPLAEKATGYNFELAKQYVALAFRTELADNNDGHLQAGDTVSLEFRVYDDASESTVDAKNFLIDAFSKVIREASAILVEEGTLAAGQEIKFELIVTKDEDYYNTAAKGNYDLIFSTWGGAAINPVGLMQVYCDKTFTSCCEYGFAGRQGDVLLDIDLNHDGAIGNGETKSFHDWWTEASGITETDERGSEAWNQKHDKILTILAGLEAGIINRFEAVPVVARATASLNSYKIENGTTNYINLIGYGGIRHLKFNFDDAQWKEFLAQYKDQLKDLYKD